MFNEKIYLVLWFWVLIVGLITLVNAFYWLIQMIIPQNRIHFVTHLLKISPELLPDKHDIRNFVTTSLKPDGVPIFRFIGTLSGEMVAGRLIRAMYDD